MNRCFLVTLSCVPRNDVEEEEDTGLVDRAPTSVGKGQRRLET